MPKIAKGVEGGGDLSVCTLVCSMIAIGYWTLAGGSNNKNNDLSRGRRAVFIGMFGVVGKDPLAPKS